MTFTFAHHGYSSDAQLWLTNYVGKVGKFYTPELQVNSDLSVIQGTQKSRLGGGSSGSISNFLTALGQRMMGSRVICFPSFLTFSDESFSRWIPKTEVTSLRLITYDAQKDKDKVDLIFFLMKRRSGLPAEFLKHCLGFTRREKAQ